jgi:hypothetical protein
LSEFEEKIFNLLKKIDEKLDILLDTKRSEGVGTIAVASKGGGYVKPSAVVEKQEEEQKAIEKPPVEGRRVCPACGGTTFNTEEDRTVVELKLNSKLKQSFFKSFLFI